MVVYMNMVLAVIMVLILMINLDNYLKNKYKKDI